MAKPDPLVLSVLHAGRKDRMVMRSLINLISGSSDAVAWELSEDSGGDVTIVDVDSSAGEQEWRALLPHTGALIAMTRRADFEAPVLLAKPLRSREFRDLLARFAAGEMPAVEAGRITSAQESEPLKADSAAASEGDASSAVERGMTLADHLRGQSWEGPVALTYEGWPVLLIDSWSGSWFYDGSIGDLDPKSFAQQIPASAGVSLSNTELVQRIEGYRQRPLSELKWYAGLAQSPGRLHPDLHGDTQFMLMQVPPEAMKNELLHELARIALRGPISFQRLLEESEQPEANVSAFLNACYCSGKLLVNRSARAASF